MVVVTSAETKTQLPQLTLESMTKDQLEEFIPHLVTKVTGRTSPQFGSLKDKPDWWPGDLEWTNPEQLSDIYQDPCDKLREIVRSGYFHMDQDSLLNSSDLTDFNADLPLSPATEDIPTNKEEDSDNKMTIQNEEASVIDLEESMEILSDNLDPNPSDKIDKDVDMEVIDVMGSEYKKETRHDSKVGVVSEKSKVVKSTGDNPDQCVSKVCKVPEGSKDLIDTGKDPDCGISKVGKVSGKSKIVKDSYNNPDCAITGIVSKVSEKSKFVKDTNNDLDCAITGIVGKVSEKSKVVKDTNNDLDCAITGIVGKVSEKSEVVEKTGKDADHGITGIVLPANNGRQNITQDIIAQIDEQIANSLKEAFGTLGYKYDEKRTVRRGSPLGFEYSAGSDKAAKRKKVKARRHSSESLSDLQRNMPESHNMPEPRRVIKPINTKSEVNLSQTDKSSAQVGNTTKAEAKLDFVKSSHSRTATVKDLEPVKDEKSEDDVVWICFVCAKGFPDQATLVKHQDECEDKPVPTSCDVTHNKPSTSTSSDVTHNKPSASTSSASMKTREPGVSQTRERNVSVKENVGKPVPTLLRKVGSNIKSLPLGLPTKRPPFRYGNRKFTDVYIPPNRDLYFESLSLVPTQKVEEIAKSPRKSLTAEDCPIIDLTIDDAQQTLPPTPRTPKSLMSQLSRDDSSGRRRQLSFSSPCQAQILQTKKSVETDSSSESSADEVITQTQKVPSKSVVLGIPLTSPLGQRLKKHWNYENKVPIVEDMESFCKTDRASLISPEEKIQKSRMVEKLRNRPPPQCTFRFTKKYINKWFHKYKFNKAEKYEFQKTLRFGLNRESRLKLKRMKSCNVALSRISPKDIKYWTTPKTQPRKFLPDTSSLKQYNRRCRQNQIQTAMYSRGPSQQYVQNFSFCSLGQVRNSGPTPQLLVRSVPMGVQGTRLQVLPIQQTPFNQNTTYNTQKQTMPVSGSQKRKQVFTNVREDDNMIICLSSDEEELDDGKLMKSVSNAKSVIVACAACKVNKDTCKTHGKKKIGPASYMKGLLNKPAQSFSQSPQSNVKDNKPACPANIISHKPVSASQQYPYSNTASAKVFGNSFVPLPIGSMSIQSSGIYGIHHVTEQFISQPVISQPVISQSGSVIQNDVIKSEEATNEMGVQSTDSDYMDYEVICIDSDDDE